jgi:hypothetical protein
VIDPDFRALAHAAAKQLGFGGRDAANDAGVPLAEIGDGREERILQRTSLMRGVSASLRDGASEIRGDDPLLGTYQR